MKKIVLRPVEGGQKAVELTIGKTIIGRGPLLECSDKKVSRNHAVLEVTEGGEVFLTPTHVNPCFFQAQNKGPSKVMKKDKQQLLQSGDSIALLPSSYKYIVEVTNSSSSSSISPDLKESRPVDDADNKDSIAEKPATAVIPSEEAKKNGSAEENHHVTTSTTTKTENGDRGSSKEPSPEAVSKLPPTAAARKGVAGTTAKAGDDSKSKSASGGTRTLPRWLLDSAAKSTSVPASGKAKATSNVQKGKQATAEPTALRKSAKEPAAKVRGGQAKVSVSGAENEPEDHSEDEGSEEESEEEYKPKKKKTKKQEEERHPAVPTRDRKGGRSSRQNRGLMQKISLDDFIASDDDEWDNSSDEWKPKKRRRQVDDSGSDWEEENRRTKKATVRYAASDSDSASDWERSSRRKKPTTRTRNRRKRSTSESGSSEESEEAPVRRGQRRQPAKRTTCKYGKKCFRKNAQHLKQFSHPNDSDYEGSSADEEESKDEEEAKDRTDDSDAGSDDDRGKKTSKRPAATAATKKRTKPQQGESDRDGSGDEDDRPMCRYGKECFRKNAQHLKNFRHPAASKKKEPPKPTSKKAKPRRIVKGLSEEEEEDERGEQLGDEYEWKDDEDVNNDSNEGDGSEQQKKATPTKRKRTAERAAAASAAADD